MFGCVSAHVPWNAMSYLERRRSYQALCDDLVMLSGMTLNKICRRDHALTVDAIKKQLLLRNKVSLALDRWTSRNKLAITSVIAYYMNRHWEWCEVQLGYDEVDRLFCSL
jgi:hypothetical protein